MSRGAFPLRTKLVVLTFSLLIGFGLTLGIYLKALFAEQLSQELLKRGVSIARHLSTLSVNAFIEGDSLYLDYLAKEHQKTEADIAYIFMLDARGEVLAHSFADSYPVELTRVNPLSAGETSHLVRVDTGVAEQIFDIAVPVLDGDPGSIHLGISASGVNQAVNTLILKIIGVIGLSGLVALVLALFASQRISRPIRLLTDAAKALAKGERDFLQVQVQTHDEVGELTGAFNHMVEELGQAESELINQKLFLEALLDDIPLPVFYTDLHGQMLGCNRAYCVFWGRTRTELVGREATAIHPTEEAAVHRSKDAEVVGKGQALSYEHDLRDAADVCRQVVFHKAPFYTQNHQLGGIVGVMIDVSAERQTEKFRREFVSTVAHEFQTPLTTIIGFADLLQSNALEPAQVKDALDVINGKAEALSRMVDELLDLSRVEAGKGVAVTLERTDLRPILVETLDGFRTSHTCHQLSMNLPDGPFLLDVDPNRMVQVIDNLLSNAVKYSPAGTRIGFSVQTDETGLCLTVVDQGVGMTAEQQSHLFEKFYRADTSTTAPAGTGLGLHICKAIIDAHGGKIVIHSEPHQGTRVIVSLPAPAPASEMV